MPHKHTPHKHSPHKHSPHKHEHTDKKHQDGHSQVSKHSHPSKHKHSGLLDQLHLRRIERLRGAYRGKEIWVLATGPSLDDIPRDFLTVPKKKISIAVKEAAMRFPDCTYNIFPYRDYPLRHMYLPRGQIPSSFGKFIFSIRKTENVNFFGKQTSKATYIRYVRGGTIERMGSMCKSIVAGNSSVYYGVGTITHLAIASALVMGASKISLVGCDHGAIGDKLRAQSIRGGYGWQAPLDQTYENMKVGTNFLADYFRNHGVEIVRYYHGRGYEPIGKAREESESDEAMEGDSNGE
ncbi:hypothetical protein ES703_93086 [subsurface metagenome]